MEHMVSNMLFLISVISFSLNSVANLFILFIGTGKKFDVEREILIYTQIITTALLGIGFRYLLGL